MPASAIAAAKLVKWLDLVDNHHVGKLPLCRALAWVPWLMLPLNPAQLANPQVHGCGFSLSLALDFGPPDFALGTPLLGTRTVAAAAYPTEFREMVLWSFEAPHLAARWLLHRSHKVAAHLWAAELHLHIAVVAGGHENNSPQLACLLRAISNELFIILCFFLIEKLESMTNWPTLFTFW
jgi:hypothetical protein